MMKKFFLSWFALIALLFSQSALSHEVGGNGFVAGLTHPVGGLDHLLAMIAVGLISTQMFNTGKIKPIFAVPFTFVSIMLLGGYVGFWGIDVSMSIVELGIVGSVILLGLGVALGKSILSSTLMHLLVYLTVALFGFYHGYAHGVEMPAKANAAYYAAGFVISTILIHIAGVVVGYLFSMGKEKGDFLLRIAGGGISLAGLKMLFF